MERGRFYYLLAKSFADSGDVERAIVYLRKARDEGYSEYTAAKKDPSFAVVMKSPEAEEVFAPRPIEGDQP